ncbi:MAG: galactosyltransferase-related protein [Bacteroidales bacterium]
MLIRSGLLGCNMGTSKSDLIKVNGFDEDCQIEGIGKDSDLEWRLRKLNVDICTVRYKCISYHLHHKVCHNKNSERGRNNWTNLEKK